MKSFLESGQKIKLSKLSSFNIPHQELFTKVEGKVIDINDQQVEIKLLNLDRNFAEIEFIRIGIILNLCFVGDDALYKVGVEVKEIRNVSKLVLKQVSGLQKIQRRRSIRIPVQERIKYSIAQNNKKNVANSKVKLKSFSATMLDISMFGLKIEVDSLTNLEENKILNLFLDFSFLEKASIQGRIIRIEEENKILGIEFLDISDSDRQKLTRWIFEQEKKIIDKNKKDLSK